MSISNLHFIEKQAKSTQNKTKQVFSGASKKRRCLYGDHHVWINADSAMHALQRLPGAMGLTSLSATSFSILTVLIYDCFDYRVEKVDVGELAGRSLKMIDITSARFDTDASIAARLNLTLSQYRHAKKALIEKDLLITLGRKGIGYALSPKVISYLKDPDLYVKSYPQGKSKNTKGFMKNSLARRQDQRPARRQDQRAARRQDQRPARRQDQRHRIEQENRKIEINSSSSAGPQGARCVKPTQAGSTTTTKSNSSFHSKPANERALIVGLCKGYFPEKSNYAENRDFVSGLFDRFGIEIAKSVCAAFPEDGGHRQGKGSKSALEMIFSGSNGELSYEPMESDSYFEPLPF